MKKLIHLINWLFSREVLEAINNGSSYEEVKSIAEKEDTR